MNVFADALADIHADPDVSVACAWAPSWARAWPRTMLLDLEAGTATLTVQPAELRCIDAQPREPAYTLGGPAILADSRRISIPIAELPAEPDRGDQVDVGAASYAVDAAPERDVEGLTWFITLAEID